MEAPKGKHTITISTGQTATVDTDGAICIDTGKLARELAMPYININTGMNSTCSIVINCGCGSAWPGNTAASRDNVDHEASLVPVTTEAAPVDVDATNTMGVMDAADAADATSTIPTGISLYICVVSTSERAAKNTYMVTISDGTQKDMIFAYTEEYPNDPRPNIYLFEKLDNIAKFRKIYKVLSRYSVKEGPRPYEHLWICCNLPMITTTIRYILAK